MELYNILGVFRLEVQIMTNIPKLLGSTSYRNNKHSGVTMAVKLRSSFGGAQEKVHRHVPYP